MKRERRFIYLGWQGRGNFGDDLLVETWRAAINDALPIEAPLYLNDLLTSAPTLLRAKLATVGAEKLILLGGGTALGYENWAKHIRNAMLLFGTRYIFSAGAGSAESNDSFSIGLQSQNWDAWRNLKHMTLAGVRGPLTQTEVSTHWQPTEIIGDPALMYPRVHPVRRSSESARILGICLGSHNATRFDIAAVAEAVAAACRLFGLQPSVFQLADSDTDVCRSLATRLGNAPIERYDGDVAAMMERIATTSAFVSERLHGAVAAVSLGIPCTPLAYASKCDDFWLSVTSARPVINPKSTVEEISRAIVESRAVETLGGIAERVANLQARLLKCANALAQWRRGHDTWISAS